MLRRVVVENYIFFKARQELDLNGAYDGCFYTLIGENASGKSSFVSLIKAASNFGDDSEEDFEVIGGDLASAKVVCEFCFLNGQELLQHFERLPPTSTRILLSTIPWVSGFFSWFSDDILKFPLELAKLLRGTFGSCTASLRVFAGRRSFYSSDPAHCQFLYVVSEDIVLVVIKNNRELSVAFHDPLPAGVDFIEWCPGEAFLRKIELDEGVDIAEGLPQIKLKRLDSGDSLRYRDVKNLIILNLLRSLPRECIDECLGLFHEIMGDHGLMFELNLDGHVPLRILDTVTGRYIQRPSEGTFSAFVVAVLIVQPLSRTIIFDEVARGMHPLQTRRLRTILMRESRNRRKCIVTTTHSPEIVDVERIALIWRFQVLPSGYCQMRRVSSRYTVRDLHFIGGAEVREIFFARYIVWVEGESDKRFIEAFLRLFDEGNLVVLKTVSESGEAMKLSGLPDGSSSGSADLPSSAENPSQDPGHGRMLYPREVLSKIQEAVRSCIVLSISGKKNIHKATAICHDLAIPHAVVCDLDAIIPNSKENSVQSQYDNCKGVWKNASIVHAKTKLVDEDQCPASKCVQDSNPGLISKLCACRTVAQVMKFYEKTQRIFTWHVDGGEIEDAIRLTKSQFGMKLWPDLSFEDVKELVVCLLQPRHFQERNPADRDVNKQPNPELLRCIFFLVKFFKESIQS